MPFTFSHPAIILPLSRIRNISLSGLIAGSMAPDFDYFIRMKIYGPIGHSLQGIFLFDLPVAIMMTIGFHQLIKVPMINSLPTYLYKRLILIRDFDFVQYLRKHYLIFTGSLLTGIISHLLWDSFTHATSPFVNGNLFLTANIQLTGSIEIPLYRLLQHISTLIGAIIIMVFFHRQEAGGEENNFSYKFWITTLIAAIIAFGIRFSFGYQSLSDVIVMIMSAGMVGLICASVIFYLTQRSKPTSS